MPSTSTPSDFDTLTQAFRLVDPTCAAIGRDWKDAISTFGSPGAIAATCESLGVTLEQVLESIEFFTATKGTVTERKGLLYIEAAGYRAGPAW